MTQPAQPAVPDSLYLVRRRGAVVQVYAAPNDVAAAMTAYNLDGFVVEEWAEPTAAEQAEHGTAEGPVRKVMVVS